jgi:hypothetical protein
MLPQANNGDALSTLQTPLPTTPAAHLSSLTSAGILTPSRFKNIAAIRARALFNAT